VLGAITIGAGSRVGANAVVVKPVPENAVVVGVPGEIITTRGAHPHPEEAPDLEHGQLPDVLGDAVADLIGRVTQLELQLDGGIEHQELAYVPVGDVWCDCDDPSI
jgi:serine O-acetyltransferase